MTSKSSCKLRLSFEQLQKLVSEEWQRNNTDMLSPGEEDTGRTTADIIQDEVKDPSRCAALAAQFGITHLLERRFKYISTGETRKTLLCQALMAQPELLILDEPFSGLDPVNVELLKEAVISLKNSGVSILFSSHRMEHVEELCENLCILQKGKPVVQGKLKEIKRSFGKKNVTIHSDDDLRFLQSHEGILQWKETADGVKLQIANEDISQEIFAMLQGKGFIRKFELEEPSLHDIFIEKVGAVYE